MFETCWKSQRLSHDLFVSFKRCDGIASQGEVVCFVCNTKSSCQRQISVNPHKVWRTHQRNDKLEE